jgi:hypothetical protein
LSDIEIPKNLTYDGVKEYLIKQGKWDKVKDKSWYVILEYINWLDTE